MKAFPRTLLSGAPFHSASCQTLRPHLGASLTALGAPSLVRAGSTRHGLSPGPYSAVKLRSAPALARGFSTDKKPGAEEPPPFAFAFDIDGVLLHVAKPIPGASETLQYLQKHNIPFILLTNGGGKHETERVSDLSARLDVPLSTDNFVQSHTPFQELVHAGPEGEGLRDKNILVTGSNAAKSREIAEVYGFRNVITPADILMAHPSIWPFEPLMKELYAATARPLPTPQPKIDAIFVFNDPRDWALDIQIIVDLLLSRGGVLGTYSPKNGRADLPNAGWQEDGQPRLYFSNPDLFWAAQYHFPRFGQGAFQGALGGIWREVTGGAAGALRSTVIGKPHGLTYGYAERVLNAHRAKVLGTDPDRLGPLRRVYMVGDNPESDIRGANQYRSPAGTDWASVLVRTGVWSAERGPPTHEPRMVVDDVKAAVDWALKQEDWR
ncbi:hypothetical protein DL770_006951 [Monosporascus sp. CRB-9-2]|nr:hypothetical protein DL770_006951 [Monosporascus sp. CRB-9-2]